MNCKKCGAEVKQNARFCPSCGSTIEWEQQPKKKMPKKIKALLILVVVLIIGGVAYTKIPKTVNLNNYVTKCKVKGYDGYGTASIDYKYEKFHADMTKYLKRKNRGITDAELDDLLDNFSWEVSLNKESWLSNGDVIKVKYQVDKDYLKEYGIIFKAKTEKVKVKDLKKVKKVDIFDGLELKFTGDGPEIETDEIINIKKDGKNFECSVSPCNELQVGDEVTVEYTSDEPIDGVCPEKKSIKMKVPENLPHYISNPSELTKDDLKQLKDVASKVFHYQKPYDEVFDEGDGGHSLITGTEDEDSTAERSRLSNPTVIDDIYFMSGIDSFDDPNSTVYIKCSANVLIEDEYSDLYKKNVKCIAYCEIGGLKRDKKGKLQLEKYTKSDVLNQVGSEFYKNEDGVDGNSNADEDIVNDWKDFVKSGSIYKVSLSGKKKPEVVEKDYVSDEYEEDEEY